MSYAYLNVRNLHHRPVNDLWSDRKLAWLNEDILLGKGSSQYLSMEKLATFFFLNR